MSFPVENKVDFREKLSLQFVAEIELVDRFNGDRWQKLKNQLYTRHTILAYRRIGTRPASAGKNKKCAKPIIF